MGIAGLSFGVEKAFKKIFGSGEIPPEAIELGKLVDKLSPAQKKGTKSTPTERGLVGSGQVGGFLGMLASLGIPLAMELVKKVLGKRVHLQPPKGKGMRLQPPPIVGSWDKKKKLVDVPLSNFDLWDWCEYLKIPLKGIFVRNEKMGKKSLLMHH